MASLSVEIPKAIKDVMVASGLFDGLNGWIIGTHPLPPNELYPLCEIAVLPERRAIQQTGILNREVRGFVRFSAMIQDDLTPDNNGLVIVSSYNDVIAYVDNFRELFEKNANRTLGSPTLPGGELVERIQVDAVSETGVALRDMNPEHESAVEWVVTTQKVRT